MEQASKTESVSDDESLKGAAAAAAVTAAVASAHHQHPTNGASSANLYPIVTSQSFMTLPPIAPISPEADSPSPPSGGGADKKYSCGICHRSFKHRHVLQQHYITHTILRPYKCDYCDFAARQKASLWRHKQKHLIEQNLPNNLMCQK